MKRLYKTVPLTSEGQYIFLRASKRQEYEYRKADRMDAEVAELRLRCGGILFHVAPGLAHPKATPRVQS